MRRTLLALLAFLLTATACIEEEDPPITFCEVEQGHLCGESAPGVTCPQGTTCERLGEAGFVCQRRCYSEGAASDAACVHPFCEGRACEDNYTCRAVTDTQGDTGRYSCDSGPMVYACVEHVWPCPDRSHEVAGGWCVFDFWEWAESGL